MSIISPFILITLLCCRVFSASAKEASLNEFLFSQKLQTDSVIIYHKDSIVLEKYSNGYNKNSLHNRRLDKKISYLNRDR